MCLTRHGPHTAEGTQHGPARANTGLREHGMDRQIPTRCQIHHDTDRQVPRPCQIQRGTDRQLPTRGRAKPTRTAHPSVRLPVRPPVRPSACPSVRPAVRLSGRPAQICPVAFCRQLAGSSPTGKTSWARFEDVLNENPSHSHSGKYVSFNMLGRIPFWRDMSVRPPPIHFRILTWEGIGGAVPQAELHEWAHPH